MANQTLNVRGMTCEHCRSAVEESVSAVEGVNDVTVNLESGEVAVGFDDTKAAVEDIKDAIEEQGYEVIPTIE
ncbi:copper chaperone CopZ [Macrococcus equipercicus]|uniref:Copper chaperone CopZ n=1 Tax=Macrococcus equipercicus TaxID=69967 RepID=A0A9Q9BTL4_9STAP|nr:copper chaperone CopZ [Macrococcus equipercicus]UTH14124.1 copper chaperone CopZ [Macrococcus equipercicus]